MQCLHHAAAIYQKQHTFHHRLMHTHHCIHAWHMMSITLKPVMHKHNHESTSCVGNINAQLWCGAASIHHTESKCMPLHQKQLHTPAWLYALLSGSFVMLTFQAPNWWLHTSHAAVSITALATHASHRSRVCILKCIHITTTTLLLKPCIMLPRTQC